MKLTRTHLHQIQREVTHYDEKLKSEATQEVELVSLNQKLAKIIKVCLLTEAGFNTDEIKNMKL